ncbi:hypothetical protein ACHQM5_012689 [Ranunculus cassubicifolius]
MKQSAIGMITSTELFMALHATIYESCPFSERSSLLCAVDIKMDVLEDTPLVFQRSFLMSQPHTKKEIARQENRTKRYRGAIQITRTKAR